MGVTLRRLGFAALALGAVLLPRQKPPREPVTLPANDRGMRLQALTQEMQAARLRWIALAERDSVLAMLGRSGALETTPFVRLQGFDKAGRATGVEAAVTKLWSAIGTTDSGVRTAVYVYNEAAYLESSWWGIYWGNLITKRDGVTWCVTIVPGEVRSNGRLLVGSELIDQAIAPCALLAAFGPPGAGIAAWLDATRYNSARSNNWLTRPKSWEGDGEGPWEWLFDRTLYYMEPGEGLLIRGLGGLPIALLLSPPYQYGAPGIRCLVGEEAECVAAVLHSGLTTAPDPGVPHDLTVSASLLRPAVTLATPRPPVAAFLSDLIREHGREKALAFWKSGLPLEQAFELAFGEPLGAWTARWARGQWESSWKAKYGNRTILLGANLAASWPLVVLGWTALALAAVAWAATRKQITA